MDRHRPLSCEERRWIGVALFGSPREAETHAFGDISSELKRQILSFHHYRSRVIAIVEVALLQLVGEDSGVSLKRDRHGCRRYPDRVDFRRLRTAFRSRKSNS